MTNFKIVEQEITIAHFTKGAYSIAKKLPAAERTAEQELLTLVDYRTMAFPIFHLDSALVKRVRNGDVIVQFANGNVDVVSEAAFNNFTGGLEELTEGDDPRYNPDVVVEEEPLDKASWIDPPVEPLTTLKVEAARAEEKAETLKTEPVLSKSEKATSSSLLNTALAALEENKDKEESPALRNRKPENTADEAAKKEPNPVANVPAASKAKKS